MVDVILLTIIVVCIVDVSGFVDSLKSAIKYLVTGGKMSDPNYSLKPIDCSLCMSFWTNLVYIIATGQFSLWILAFILLCSVMTPVIKDIIFTIRDILTKLIGRI